MMSAKRVLLIVAGLLVILVLAACAPLPPLAAGEPAQVATAAPVATATPNPTAAPAIPDPRSDPMAALLYAGQSGAFKSAEFDYVMSLVMEPADEASAAALGDAVEELTSVEMEITGKGAMEITDPDALEVKMRMDMEFSMAGDQMTMEMVMIGQTAWVRVGGTSDWQKVEGEQATSAIPGGMDPQSMFETFKNATDVQWIEDVELNGQQVSHLRFTVDPAKLDLGAFDSLTNQAEMSQEQFEEMMQGLNPVVDIWLAKDDLGMRREQMALDFVMPLPEEVGAGYVNLRLAMTMDMTFTNVNEPVTIEDPTK